MKNSFLSEKLEFEIDGSILTENQIKSIIPNNLKNKEDFISFYMAHNGIYFHDGAFMKRSRFYQINKNEYDELEIEFFYEIGNDLEKMWNASKEHSEDAKLFAQKHIPFASDAAGNEFWIEIETGIVKYISWEYDFPEAITIAAPSFKEFCQAIEPYR